MKIVSFAMSLLVASFAFKAFANDQFCSDDTCKKLEEQYFKKEYDKIIAAIDPKKRYSEGSSFYIGMSYTILAERTDSPEAKDKLYRQAIAIKYYPAYMSLYNLYRGKNPEAAMAFVKEYIKTDPRDPAPFLVLSEAQFNKRNYSEADKYLRKARQLSKGHTSKVDWLLFKTNYILGNYTSASQMFESAIAQSRFTEEIQALKSDTRFVGIENRPEFKQYKPLFSK